MDIVSEDPAFETGPLQNNQEKQDKDVIIVEKLEENDRTLSFFSSQSFAAVSDKESKELLGSYNYSFDTAESHKLVGNSRNWRDNYIRTTKYTLWTFLPVNLFSQFRRIYNVCFLLSAVFVLIEPSLNPVTEVLPLFIVMFVSALKDGLEDYKRYKSDQKENSRLCTIVIHGQLHQIQSQFISPGDIVYVQRNDKIPADIAILSSSGEDGVCFVDTVELDGETNLKRRNEVPVFVSEDELNSLSGHVQCEKPNENLCSFEGVLTLESHSIPKVAVPLTIENLLLRGMFLKNTEHAYGLVVYAGSETKIFKNLKHSGLKFSTLEWKLNRLIVYIFMLYAFFITSSMIFAYVSPINLNYAYPNAWYLDSNDAEYKGGFSAFMVFFVLYSLVIPISLFVSIEMVRVIQAKFMQWDDKMKSQEGKRMKVHNSNLNEDLGSIEYIFSDKTGTLTRNIMTLFYCFVGTKEFNFKEHKDSMSQFYHSREAESSRELLRIFCRCITLCNSGLPVYTDDSEHPTYEAQSSDEVALLNGICASDVWLTQRAKKKLTISIFGQREEYEILAELDFNSDRKRMTVVVKNYGSDKIYIFTKGADNVIMRFLHGKYCLDENHPVKNAFQNYSTDGLRTLIFAYKQLSKEEYTRFFRVYEQAICAMSDRGNAITNAFGEIEKDLDLLGCTAIEDRLQDQVPETIECLLNADIRIWMLTGDKQETAIKIALSARLISADMNIFQLNIKSQKECWHRLGQYWEHITRNNMSTNNALVVDGESLVYALLERKLSKLFLQVIACRVTPLQKALIVRLVKKQLKKVTLSIGDGANDVSMIQEAHVGVGIEGMEGAQAVRASDYSFNEFRCLKRLILVHGRYSYYRIANIIFYSFYRNIAFMSIQFLFGYFNAWSGLTVYSGHFRTLWNFLFTGLPIIINATFDKDIIEDKIEKFPMLYKPVKDGMFWNAKIIIGWMTTALYHATALFGIMIFAHPMIRSETTLNFAEQQFFIAALVLLAVTAKFALINNYWVWPTHAAIISSLLLYIICFFGLELLGFIDGDAFSAIHSTPDYYISIFIAFPVCLLPDFILK